MKRKVLVLGSELDYIDKRYYDEFKEEYEVQVRARSAELIRWPPGRGVSIIVVVPTLCHLLKREDVDHWGL